MSAKSECSVTGGPGQNGGSRAPQKRRSGWRSRVGDRVADWRLRCSTGQGLDNGAQTRDFFLRRGEPLPECGEIIVKSPQLSADWTKADGDVVGPDRRP